MGFKGVFKGISEGSRKAFMEVSRNSKEFKRGFRGVTGAFLGVSGGSLRRFRMLQVVSGTLRCLSGRQGGSAEGFQKKGLMRLPGEFQSVPKVSKLPLRNSPKQL